MEKREQVWDRYLTERDKQVFATGGFGATQGYGKRPAVVVVDVNYAFCGERPEPILESIKRWRASCGAEAWDGVAAIAKLLAAARARGLPVVYTTGARRDDRWDAGSWAWKNPRVTEQPRTQAENLDGYTIVPQIAPQPEALIRKPISSELPWKTSRTITGISVKYGAASSATTDSVSSSARIGSRFQL